MLDLGAPALTGLVDRMSKAGLVRRIPDPKDGRSSLVELMDQGRTLRQQALERTKALNDQLCEGFSDAEIAVVARWLENVRGRYGA
jgi:DNA-binding MarR family transcriptional regulator